MTHDDDKTQAPRTLECNYTQIPNIFFDYWMCRLSPVQLAVLFCIARKTFGWQKIRDKISLRQIEAMTGISKKTVIDALKALQDLGLIEIEKGQNGDGGNATSRYEIIVHVPEETVNKSLPGVATTPPPGVATKPPPGVATTPTKERPNKRKQTTTMEPIDFPKKDLVVVVSSPSLSSLEIIPQEQIPKLIKEAEAHAPPDMEVEDYINEKVEMLKSLSCGVDNPYGWLKKALAENWKPTQKAEDKAPENKRWAEEKLRKLEIRGVRIDVCNTEVEFVYTGQKPAECYKYTLASFKEVVRSKVNELVARAKGL